MDFILIAFIICIVYAMYKQDSQDRNYRLEIEKQIAITKKSKLSEQDKLRLFEEYKKMNENCISTVYYKNEFIEAFPGNMLYNWQEEFIKIPNCKMIGDYFIVVSTE